jgi:hypothetical protein
MPKACAASRTQKIPPRAGGVAATLGSSKGQGLSGDHAELVVAVHRGVFVHHPRHDLRRRVDVGSRHVLLKAEHPADLANVGAREALELAGRHLLGIADDPAFRAAQRNVDDGRFPGHPRRESANRVDGLVGVEADAALRRSARVVVLNSEAVEDLRRAVVHLDREPHVELTHGPPQKLMDGRIELQDLGSLVELALGDVEGIVVGHGVTS